MGIYAILFEFEPDTDFPEFSSLRRSVVLSNISTEVLISLIRNGRPR